MSSSLSDRVTGVVTGRRTAALVALVPLLLAVLAILFVGEGEREARSTDSVPAGLDSTRGTELRDALPEDDSSAAVVVLTADEGTFDDATVRELGRLGEEVGGVATGPDGPVTVAEDGTAAIVVVPVAAGSATDTADAVTALRERLDEGVPAGVTAQVTGPAAIQADLAAVFDGADFRLLGATAAVVAILLILTYRSPCCGWCR